MSRHQQIETKLTYECVNSVTDWMQSNRLQLNNDKTESLWCTTVRRQYRLPTSGPTIGSFTVTPSSMVLDFGVYIDADLSMHSRVRRNVAMFHRIAPDAFHPAAGKAMAVYICNFSGNGSVYI